MLDTLQEVAAQQAGQIDFILVYASSVYASTGVFELFVFSALLLWYFNPRLREAMDVISAHVVQKYSDGWSGGPASAALLRHKMTQGQHRSRERVQKERSKVEDTNRIGAVKTQPWVVLTRRPPRPLPGASCDTCVPTNKQKFNKATNDFRILNILNVKTLDTAPTGVLGSVIPDIALSCSLAKYDYPYIHDTVLKDENLTEAIEAAARQAAEELKVEDENTYNALLAAQWKRATSILSNLRSTLSDLVIRVSAWVFLKTLPLMFSSMACPAKQIESLREASSTGLPLLFLPLHRSHMDYIALTLALCTNNIRSPLVASGENLRIPVFGWILRGLGAFFIKRRMDPVEGKKDIVYRAVLHTYVTHAISAGHSFEFFIEGRRSRTGKPSMPKGGLLSIFIDAYLSGVLQDALLVPVSVNCERLVDDSFLNELTGAPKDPESFSSTVAAIWSALTTHYGQIRIDFGQPFSLNELVRAAQARVKNSGSSPQGLHVAPSTASLYGTDIVVEEQRQLVDSLARHVIYDCVQTTAVMSTNAVALLLLHEHRKGVSLDELVTSLDNMRAELRYSNKDTGFTGHSLDVINHALRLLGPGLVQREKTLQGEIIKPVTMLPNVLELAYYANVLMPHYILSSVVSVAVLVELEESLDTKVTLDKLIDSCHTLCQILQFEFLFTRPCQSLYEALNETVDTFNTYSLINLLEKPTLRPTFEGRILDIEDDFDEQEDARVASPIYKVDKSNPKLHTYASMVRNILDTYSIVGHCLHTLIGRPQTERELVKYCLQQTKARLEKGNITYGESVSTETITNCIRLFEKDRVLEGHHEAGVKLLCLRQGCETEETLAPHIQRIHRFTNF